MDGYRKLEWICSGLTIVFGLITLIFLSMGKGDIAGTFFTLGGFSFGFIFVAKLAREWGD